MIDQPTIEKMTAGDDELLADLANLFVQLLPDLEARFRIALETQDAGEIESIAHQLKSRVSYFGALSLHELANEVELSARVGDDLSGLDRSCRELLEGVEKMLVELRIMTKLPLEVDRG